MSFPFTKKVFVNNSASPAINATALNELEDAMDYVAVNWAVVPTGAGMEWYNATPPSGWLMQDGSAVSRTTHSALFSIIGTTFGAGDGSTTFNLPNKAEAVSVGVGTRSSGVTAHDTYTLGQFKDDQAQGMSFAVALNMSGSSNPGASYTVSSQPLANATGWSTTTTGSQTFAPHTDGPNGTPRTGTTTHGKQIGVYYIIKT